MTNAFQGQPFSTGLIWVKSNKTFWVRSSREPSDRSYNGPLLVMRLWKRAPASFCSLLYSIRNAGYYFSRPPQCWGVGNVRLQCHKSCCSRWDLVFCCFISDQFCQFFHCFYGGGTLACPYSAIFADILTLTVLITSQIFVGCHSSGI